MAALAVPLLSCYDKFVCDPREFAEQSVLQNSLGVHGFNLFCTFEEPHERIRELADALIFLPFRGSIQRYRISSVFKKIEDGHAAFLFYNALTTVRGVHPAYLVAIFEGEQNDQFRCVVNRQLWHGEGSEYCSLGRILFEHHDSFNKTYAVYGNDEARVRRMLNDEILESVVRMSLQHLEIFGRIVLVAGPDWVYPVESAYTFYNIAVRIKQGLVL